ncbi:MAG: hypothetical protein ABR616_01730 [Dermatophilaceae bacterium]
MTIIRNRSLLLAFPAALALAWGVVACGDTAEPGAGTDETPASADEQSEATDEADVGEAAGDMSRTRPAPPGATFEGPLQRSGDRWIVEADANGFVLPDGGPAQLPGTNEPTTYHAIVDDACAVMSRDQFISRMEGQRIVMQSIGDEWDVGDSAELFLSGAWRVSDPECVEG